MSDENKKDVKLSALKKVLRLFFPSPETSKIAPKISSEITQVSRGGKIIPPKKAPK